MVTAANKSALRCLKMRVVARLAASGPRHSRIAIDKGQRPAELHNEQHVVTGWNRSHCPPSQLPFASTMRCCVGQRPNSVAVDCAESLAVQECDVKNAFCGMRVRFDEKLRPQLCRIDGGHRGVAVYRRCYRVFGFRMCGAPSAIDKRLQSCVIRFHRTTAILSMQRTVVRRVQSRVRILSSGAKDVDR
jgi:hypothetical protein